MNIVELLLFIGIVAALWNIIPKSKKKITKFGEGLLCDTKMNDNTTDDLDIWRGF